MEIRAIASGSGGNAYYISDSKTPLLLECGIPFKILQRELDFKVYELGACLITHEHQDHCKAVEDMLKAGVDCYASLGTLNALGLSGRHRVKGILPHEAYSIGSWRLRPFEVEHDAAEPLGFLLANTAGEKLLYVTDSYYCRYKFGGLTHIMIECNHSYEILNYNVAAGLLPQEMKNRLIHSHFALENVKEFLKANDLSKVQEIYLIHMSAGNSDGKKFKREIMELTGKPCYIAG